MQVRLEAPSTLVLDMREGQRRYPIAGDQHADYLDLYERLAAEAGTRLPLSRRAPHAPAGDGPYLPLLTEPVSPRILYGYGDPSVIRVLDDAGRPEWFLVVTSNDAPDAFPILRSRDLVDWRLSGFVFEAGETPAWAATGANVADFWAPEMHRVGDEYWLVFAARRHDRTMAIGLARSARPEGPYTSAEAPILAGGVIDPHVLVGPRGTPYLVWKVDDNALWPRRLAALLHRHPQLIETVFLAEEDRRTAAVVAALQPWSETREPMEQFFIHQPLIEAATDDFLALGERVAALAASADEGVRADAEAMLRAMKTRVYAQPLAPDGSALVGEPTLLLENDQTWEAHLIEGVWTLEHQGRYYIFYAGNDFSTPHYGVGGAVADRPLGPYRKAAEPLLRSTRDWWGPGHPSAALGPDGEPWMFLHAFHPGAAGYKAFRALLASRLELGSTTVSLSRPVLPAGG
jgi:hypothetical protein